MNIVPLKRELNTEPMSAQQSELVQRLERLTKRSALRITTPVNSVELFRAESTTQLLPAVYQPCLCFVAQGSKRALLDGVFYVYDPLHYLVVSTTMPVCAEITDASVTKPYLALLVKIDTAEIASLVSDRIKANNATQNSAKSNKQNSRALYSAAMKEPMLDVILRLVRLLDNPQDCAVLAPLALREVYYRALTDDLGERLQQLVVTDSYAQRVGRALELLRSQYHLPLRMQTLADAAHMSLSSLHHHFKSVTAMSPLQYQKQLRLHEAKRLILNDGIDAANAAHRVGYASPSQFSRDYKRLFGASPKRQLSSHRAPLQLAQ